MLSYKLDFSSCAIRDSFCKSSHIYKHIHIYTKLIYEPKPTIDTGLIIV